MNHMDIAKKFTQKTMLHNAEAQMLDLLKENASGYLVIIQGESGLGKTRLIKSICADLNSMLILSYEQLVEIIIQDQEMKNTKQKEVLFQYKIVAIEDIDYLSGKERTQEIIGVLINRLLLQNVHVLITGIKLDERVTNLLSSIERNKALWIHL